MNDEQLQKLIGAVAEAAAADDPRFEEPGREYCQAMLDNYSRIKHYVLIQEAALKELMDYYQ